MPTSPPAADRIRPGSRHLTEWQVGGVETAEKEREALAFGLLPPLWVLVAGLLGMMEDEVDADGITHKTIVLLHKAYRGWRIEGEPRSERDTRETEKKGRKLARGDETPDDEAKPRPDAGELTLTEYGVSFTAFSGSATGLHLYRSLLFPISFVFLFLPGKYQQKRRDYWDRKIKPQKKNEADEAPRKVAGIWAALSQLRPADHCSSPPPAMQPP